MVSVPSPPRRHFQALRPSISLFLGPCMTGFVSQRPGFAVAQAFGLRPLPLLPLLEVLDHFLFFGTILPDQTACLHVRPSLLLPASLFLFR